MLPGFIYIPTGAIDEDTLYRRNKVTDTYLRGQMVAAPALAVVVQDAGVAGLGLLERGPAITSFERRITVSQLSLLESPIPMGNLEARLPRRVQQYGAEALRFGGPVTPATWTALRDALMQSPGLRDLITHIERRASPPGWVLESASRSTQVVQQEQDALGLSLSLAGLDRDPLERWTPTDEPAPFLAGLEHTELREDQLLINDMQIFGDWRRLRANGLYSEFSDSQGRRLTVLNVNRHPLETVLGVDLIYYSHRHQAFTLVQYKRMRWESRDHGVGRDPVYRPNDDKNIGRQIERMRRVASTADGTSATSLPDYRLGSMSCFFKVCHPEFDLGSSELSKGMYMDLDLWDLVTAHLANDGSGAISFKKDLRYLNNTEFIGLVREGWIGSRGIATETIQDYVMRTLRSRHSVTLAAAVE